MKKYLFILLGSLLITGVANAESMVKADLLVRNTHGVVQSGTWFNLKLQDNITGTKGSQQFTATVTDSVYNKDFSEVLIPAGTRVVGTYLNTGRSCLFSIDTILLDDATIELQPGAYSKVNASLPNQPECNSTMNYSSSQLLEFETKVDIEELTPITLNKNYTILNSQDNFVQSYGNPDYLITSITKYTNGLMQVSVKFFNIAIKDNLLPVYFDEFGIAHPMSFNFVTNGNSSLGKGNDNYSYMFNGTHPKFGFGILE